MSACVETFYLFLHKVTTSSRGLHAASSFSTPLHTPLAKLVQNSDLPSTKKSFFRIVHSSAKQGHQTSTCCTRANSRMCYRGPNRDVTRGRGLWSARAVNHS